MSNLAICSYLQIEGSPRQQLASQFSYSTSLDRWIIKKMENGTMSVHRYKSYNITYIFKYNIFLINYLSLFISIFLIFFCINLFAHKCQCDWIF